jgi:hypothetical protein
VGASASVIAELLVGDAVMVIDTATGLLGRFWAVPVTAIDS